MPTEDLKYEKIELCFDDFDGKLLIDVMRFFKDKRDELMDKDIPLGNIKFKVEHHCEYPDFYITGYRNPTKEELQKALETQKKSLETRKVRINDEVDRQSTELDKIQKQLKKVNNKLRKGEMK